MRNYYYIKKSGTFSKSRTDAGLLITCTFFLLFSLKPAAQPAVVNNPFLQNSTHIFTAKLNYKEETFNGYLGVRYSDPDNFRISFNTTMGATLMDLEWQNGGFIKHYIPAKLDRSIIVNKLQDDFEMIFLHILTEGKWKSDSTLKVGCHKYHFTQTDQALPMIINDRNWLGFLKRTLSFSYAEAHILESLSLKHHSFALQFHLTSIK